MVGHQAPFNAIHPTFPVSRTKKRPGKRAREAARQNLTNYVQAGPSGFQPNYMPNYMQAGPSGFQLNYVPNYVQAGPPAGHQPNYMQAGPSAGHQPNHMQPAPPHGHPAPLHSTEQHNSFNANNLNLAGSNLNGSDLGEIYPYAANDSSGINLDLGFDVGGFNLDPSGINFANVANNFSGVNFDFGFDVGGSDLDVAGLNDFGFDVGADLTQFGWDEHRPTTQADERLTTQADERSDEQRGNERAITQADERSDEQTGNERSDEQTGNERSDEQRGNEIVYAVVAKDLKRLKVALTSSSADTIKMMQALHHLLTSSGLELDLVLQGCLYAICCVVDKHWEGTKAEKDAFEPLDEWLNSQKGYGIVGRAIWHLSVDRYSI